MATTTYTISDLANEFDLTTRAIRFYEDMGLLQPERSGPGGRNRVYSARDRTRLKLTLRAKRLGLSLTEAREIIDMYDSPRDTGPQLKKFLAVLAQHREQLEEQMADLQANLDEVKVHEKEARALLADPRSPTGGLTGIIDVYVNVNSSRTRHGRPALRTQGPGLRRPRARQLRSPGGDEDHRRDAGRGRPRAGS